MKRYAALTAIIFAAFFSVSAAIAAQRVVYQPTVVRVAVIKDAKELTLTIKSEFRIMSIEVEDILFSGKNLGPSTVKPMQWGIKMDDKEFKFYGIRIVPLTDSAIVINKSSFRGEVDIIRQRDQTLLVVNHINVEDYLKGVLYREVSHWWSGEALKAQAIAARTFALYQASLNHDKDYDLESTVSSQVYGGSTSEKYRTNEAVMSTIGKVLVYKGRIFPAYYHATCAGHTEDASILWGIDLAPLKGVACSFCKDSPHFYWKKEIPVSQIEKALSVKDIKDITSVKWDNSGRTVIIRIKTQDKDIDMPAKDFRLKLNANIIRSTIFKVKIAPDINGRPIAYFDGAGWGHGVGMCQWGAFGMARNGYDAERILKHYYPGADVKLYTQ